MRPAEALERGRQILEDVLLPCGFLYVEGVSGVSSGGEFASGQYVRDDRALELHFRFSLGLVTYRIADASLLHEEYMQALLGRHGPNQYPGFSDDPLEGFRHLKNDLERYCSDFLTGSGDEFRACVKRLVEAPRKTGLEALENDV